MAKRQVSDQTTEFIAALKQAVSELKLDDQIDWTIKTNWRSNPVFINIIDKKQNRGWCIEAKIWPEGVTLTADLDTDMYFDVFDFEIDATNSSIAQTLEEVPFISKDVKHGLEVYQVYQFTETPNKATLIDHIKRVICVQTIFDQLNDAHQAAIDTAISKLNALD